MIIQTIVKFIRERKNLYHRITFKISKWYIWIYCKLTYSLMRVSRKEEYILCYDNLVSPGKFGDFWIFLSLSRMLQDIFENVKLVVLIDGMRDSEDWKLLGESFVETQSRLASLMLGADYGIKISFITYADLPKNANFLLECRVRNRRPTIRHYHALYCQLSDVGNVPINRSDLLSNLCASFDDSEKAYISSIYSLIPTNYVCVHFRHNEHWGLDRQIDFNVLDDIAELSEKWGATPVFVSNVECYALVQSMSKYRNRFIFSKSIEGSGFFTDLFLTMKASIFIAHAAGGLQSFPMSSDMPFIIVCKTEHETKHSFNKLFGYHGNNQKHFEIGSIGRSELIDIIDSVVARVCR
jgi:hypothetical protein